MPMTPEEAASYIQSHARQLEATIVLAEFFKEPAALEQKVRDLNSTIANKTTELEAVQEAINTGKIDAADTHDKAVKRELEAVDLIEKSRAEAKKIEDEATAAARLTRDQAKDEARAVVAKANEEAEAVRRRISADKAELDDLRVAINAAKTELAALEGKQKTARDFLADLASKA